MTKNKSFTILYAEDDLDDQFFLREALKKSDLDCQVKIVDDGLELMEYLRNLKNHKKSPNPRPTMILLDINMPVKDGWEVLEEIRTEPDLQLIPVVMLSTSQMKENVEKAYRDGAQGYIIKPTSIKELAYKIKTAIAYWCDVVETPV